MFSLVKKRFWGDHNEVYWKAGEGYFTREYSDRTSVSFERKEEKFKLDISMKIFIQKVVRHWHRLPREAVGAPSLQVLRATLDGALGSLIWWVATSPLQRVGTGWSLKSLPTKIIL